MKKLAALTSVLLSVTSLHAQFIDTAHIDTFIYNKVYKNIAAYNIKHASYAFNGAIDDSPFQETASFFYESFLPDLNAKIVMDIENTALNYPVKGYDVYRTTFNGMQFQYDNAILSLSGVHPGNLFLVALDKENGAIKFISGQFFISAIAPDFDLDKKGPLALIPYLTFKTYADRLDSIAFKRSGQSLWYYSAYSQVLHKAVTIVLNTRNIEFYTIIPTSGKQLR